MDQLKSKVVNLLEKGIAEKRKGNLDEAVNYYMMAMEILPSYPPIYLNLAKVFIIGGKYENAFRNLLVNIHLRIIEQNEIYNNNFLDNYQIDQLIFNKLSFTQKSLFELINESYIYKQIAKDTNVTFYAGLSYIEINPIFLKIHGIDKSLLLSEKEVLSGKIPKTQNLRQSKHVNLINVIGLKWLTDNIRIELKDQDEICRYYLDSTHKIEKEIDLQDDNSQTEYDEWRKSLGGKSVFEHLVDANVRGQEGFAGFVVNIMTLIWLHLYNKIEVKLIKEDNKDLFTLFLQLEIDENELGLGHSVNLDIYHCKFIRDIKVDNNNDNGLPLEVHEFEIINLIDGGLSKPSSLKHLGKKIYIDKKAFKQQTIVIMNASGEFENQLRKTYGFEGFSW